MSLFERAKQLVDGVAILTDWIGDGGHIVPSTLSQERADICVSCPMNLSGGILETAADAIRKQLEIKNHLKIRVHGEKGLHTCQGCGCALRLKVHLPIERIRPEPDERGSFDPRCWLLKETE